MVSSSGKFYFKVRMRGGSFNLVLDSGDLTDKISTVMQNHKSRDRCDNMNEYVQDYLTPVKAITRRYPQWTAHFQSCTVL